MPANEGGAELVSFRELAKRLKADEALPALSHQRIAQLASEDPDFPPVVTVGRAKAVDWHAAQHYVRTRKGAGQGRRTDLEQKRLPESVGADMQIVIYAMDWTMEVELPAAPRIGDFLIIKGRKWTVKEVAWGISDDLGRPEPGVHVLVDPRESE